MSSASVLRLPTAPSSPYRVNNWKIDDLKNELRNRSLAIGGKKEDLLRRLERADDLK